MKIKTKREKLPVLFILVSVLPTLVLLLCFLVYPTVKSAVMSFQNVGLLNTKGDFVGLDNYTYMFKDEKFLQALKNTLKLMFVIPVITIIISFLLSVAIHRSKLREKNFYITFYFFPYFLSSTVAAIVWSFIFDPTSGILNRLLSLLGLGSLQRAWLGDSDTALWCIAAVVIWASIGYYIVLYMSGLDSIPQDLYEAAELDGATGWQQMTMITIPLMKNIVGVTLVLLMSGVLSVTFVYSRLMTNGGPNGSSNVLLRYIYTQGLEMGNIGYSSAITVFTMALAILLSAVSRTITGKSVKE